MIGNGQVKLNASIDEIANSGKSVEDIFKEVFSFGW
jgi:hypothetical protein